jgi:hypothetical protein
MKFTWSLNYEQKVRRRSVSLHEHCRTSLYRMLFLFYQFLVPLVDPSPMEVRNEVVYKFCAGGAIFMIIRMLEYIQRNQRHRSPDLAVLVFINQCIQ